MKLRRLASSVVCLALVAAACASGGQPTTDGTRTPAPASSAASSPAPASPTSESSAPTPAPSPVIEDGRNFAFIKSVDPSGDPSTVTYDLAYFLTGDEAAEAAKDHGDEVPPPNDYYVVNDNPKLRTVALAPDVDLVLLDWRRCCDETFAGSLHDFAVAINRGEELTVGGKTYKGVISPYWLIARDGTIVRIEEQYLP